MKNKIMLVSVLGVLALPAMAEGPYLIGDVGQNKIKADAGNDFKINQKDTTYLFGVGFEINKVFAIEIAYRDLGSIRDSYIYSSGGG